MSLDVCLTAVVESSVFERNITHNLAIMAKDSDLYYPLWRPEEINIRKAIQLIPLLEKGLDNLEKNRDELIKLNPKNGWGSYEGLVDFVKEYLEYCRIYPDAKISVSR